MPHVLPSPVAVCTASQAAASTTVNAQSATVQPAQHAKRESLYGLKWGFRTYSSLNYSYDTCRNCCTGWGGRGWQAEVGYWHWLSPHGWAW